MYFVFEMSTKILDNKKINNKNIIIKILEATDLLVVFRNDRIVAENKT